MGNGLDPRTLTGNRYANADQLQRRNVSAVAPSDTNVLGWNGDNKEWEPKNDAHILDVDATQTSVSVVDETSIYSYSITGGTLPTDGGFFCQLGGTFTNNTATDPGYVIIKVKLGATTALTSNEIDFVANAAARKWTLSIWCFNTGTASSQRWIAHFDSGKASAATFSVGVSGGSAQAHGSGYGTSAENTANALTFDVTVTLEDADMVLNKELGFIELLASPAASVTDHSHTTLPIDSTPSDDTASGITAELTAGTALVWGNFCCIGDDGKMEKTDADDEDGATNNARCVAFCTETIAENSEGTFLLQGFIRDDSEWNFTIGDLVFLSTTAGEVTQTAPSGADDCVVVVGVALTADVLYFNPSLQGIVEHTG
jgi:hypothetical protein